MEALQAELEITVAAPGNPETTYRFREPRVRVGRSRHCHLSLCHESVPRQLCIAWLEDGGKSVRVEPRPNLRNPLLHAGAILEGGISGKRLDLCVGPIALCFAPGGSAGRSKQRAGRRPSMRLWLGAGAALLAAAVCLAGSRDDAGAEPLRQLPSSPLCAVDRPECGPAPDCRERARLLVTRARALSAGPSAPIGDRVRAAMLLDKAEHLYRSVAAAEAERARSEARAAREAILQDYRRDAAALRQSLRSGRRGAEVAEAARRMLSYFVACDLPARRPLERLAASGSETEE